MSEANMTRRELREYFKTGAKFLCRAKSADTGTWVFGDDFYVEAKGDGQCGITEIFNYHGFVKRNGMRPHNILPHTFGGFTGLVSDNGQGVFEGDILISRPNGYKPSKVLIARAAYWYEFINEKEGLRLPMHYLETSRLLSGTTFNVIGNIHDKPELLNFIYNKEEINHE